MFIYSEYKEISSSMKEPFYDRIRYDLYNIIAYSLSWWLVIFFGWAFFITLDIAGCAITDCDNNNGYLPWHYTNIAILFYFALFCISIIHGICTVSTSQNLTKPEKIIRRCYIIILIPIALNLIFWGPFISNIAKGQYLDNVAPIVPNHKHNITSSDIVVIGNGPITMEQRSIIMTLDHTQIHRFNGMSTLYPDEPVGNLFVRKIKDNSAPSIGVGDFHGLQPPNQVSHLLDKLYNPWSHELSKRSQCYRVNDAHTIEMLFADTTDVDFYNATNGYPAKVSTFPEHAVRTMSKYGTIYHPERLSSGGIVILGSLDRYKNHIHTFGMNFGSLSNRHPVRYERDIILKNQHRITVHKTPYNTYHDFITVKNSWFRRDPRVRGFACGEWNVLWLDETRFNPAWWAFNLIPIPPFFRD
ncbi:hypothetical protein EhV066 [Emiliania huxleyi virus 86]|uniref:Putative membrane protein n=2 Tax=Emiliania huxleyi virus 86 TaxID=181082 RepID=Q4A367_EHV8U|nr:hypothetical protein EhV066 [Emiliania huxleyi virus 86]AEP15005.1 hypothetical protein EOVG_00068 [Emiliania huxleyi virus 88]AHA54634.1 putative membrane protein [Emiliania huxleyi virus 145]AHA55670.1 putative membrane protein [Emiliania huxleyi virus 164]CAI65489.1 putative membrane protein [Emiliania huxleyi virus 86]